MIKIITEKMDIILSTYKYCSIYGIVISSIMLKYTLQLWESIINTKYETWFDTQRAMNELILMASESSRNNGNSGANGNDCSAGNNSRCGSSGRSGSEQSTNLSYIIEARLN